MKRILLIVFLIGTKTLFAQQIDTTLIKEIQSLKAEVNKQGQNIEQLFGELDKEYRTYRMVRAQFNDTIRKQRETIDSLSGLLTRNSSELASVNTDLSGKIQKTDVETKNSLSQLNENLNKNRQYWIIGALVLVVLGGLIYWLLNKRISSSKTDFESQIKETNKSLEEESVKLDSKLVELLETELKLKEEENNTPKVSSNGKEDHSLALKVADEIVRMQKNISRIDNNIKGLKPLEKGIERIQANFAANGYEMVNLMNKEYEDRMNIDVITFIDDERLREGKKMITKIIKPQVNYNDTLIQRAQVEVSQN